MGGEVWVELVMVIVVVVVVTVIRYWLPSGRVYQNL